jgi:cyclase
MRLCIAGALLVAGLAQAQDPAGQLTQIRDGIYVYAAREQLSNVNIILTQEGPVMIDTGQTVPISRAALDLVKKLAPQPVRYVIHTEPHSDHTVGDFTFSPPAVVIAAAGATQSIMRNKPPAEPGWRPVLPHIEYQDRMLLNVGERSFELLHLKNVHSEADTAVWMPKERIVWAAASVGVKRFPNIRPFLTIADILASIKRMRALNPEIVVPGHGAPGTTQIFDDTERYYALLLERTARLAAAGRTLEQAKAEIRMPEFDDWSGKERFGTNVEAAWKAVKK